MERFNLKNLNTAEIKEHRVQISNRFAAFKKLDDDDDSDNDDVDIHRA
jgi:hypothetical protein